MRFVPVKTAEQQAALVLHRSRDLLVRQRTQLINAIRAHLAEIGLVSATGVVGVKSLLAIVRGAGKAGELPAPLQRALQALIDLLTAVQEQIGRRESSIHAQHRAIEASRRLGTIPGVGVIGATAIVATIADPSAFKSGRELAAWIGLVPRQNSTGGKQKLSGISKQGDKYLRRLLPARARCCKRSPVSCRSHPALWHSGRNSSGGTCPRSTIIGGRRPHYRSRCCCAAPCSTISKSVCDCAASLRPSGPPVPGNGWSACASRIWLIGQLARCPAGAIGLGRGCAAIRAIRTRRGAGLLRNR